MWNISFPIQENVFTMFSYFTKRKIIFPTWISQSGPTLGKWLKHIIDLLSIEEITSKQHSRLQDFQVLNDTGPYSTELYRDYKMTNSH